jgi:hypothetical protein
VELLDLQRVAKSFGFSNPPSVSLSILTGRWERGREEGREREGRGEREEEREREIAVFSPKQNSSHDGRV